MYITTLPGEMQIVHIAPLLHNITWFHISPCSLTLGAHALLKVFDSWISLKILFSKVTALFAHLNELRRFRRQGDTSKDYWRLLVG